MYQPCSSRWPWSRSHPISRMLALSEFSEYVSDSRRYAANRSTPARREAASVAQRFRTPGRLSLSAGPADEAALAGEWISEPARSPLMETKAERKSAVEG